MTDKTGGPAFPVNTDVPLVMYEHSGMTLRDYFAAKAMQAILSRTPAGAEGVSEAAFIYADAMLKEREK